MKTDPETHYLAASTAAPESLTTNVHRADWPGECLGLVFVAICISLAIGYLLGLTGRVQ